MSCALSALSWQDIYFAWFLSVSKWLSSLPLVSNLLLIYIILPSWKMMIIFSIRVRKQQQWVAGWQDHRVVNGKRFIWEREKTAKYRVDVEVALQKKCSNKSDLLCGFPEEHRDIRAAKESPLLPWRSLTQGCAKAGIWLHLNESVKCVWREVCLRKWTKMVHTKLLWIYLAPAICQKTRICGFL